MMTTFEKLQNKQLTSAKNISKKIGKGNWNSNRKSFAYYVASKPKFESGSIARTAYTFLVRKKRTVSLQEIVKEVMQSRKDQKKPYANYDSARRTVGRVIAQLSHWGYFIPGKNENNFVAFSLNKDKKADLPRASK